MNRPSLAVLATAAVGLLLPTAAPAATRYASPGGGATGAEPCLASDPCTLANAIQGHAPANVNDGDQVVLLGGSGPFNPAGQINILKRLDIGGASGLPVPVINGAGTVGLANLASGATLHDLQINQAAGTEAISLDSTTVERVFATYGGAVAGGACAISESSVVRDSVCWATGNTGAGIFNGGGVVQAKLRNVTAVGSGASGIGIRFDENASSASIQGVNVIARGTALDVRAMTPNVAGPIASVTLANSDFATAPAIGTGASATAPGTSGNITAPPLFANAAGGDFRELAGSPTIDTGQPAGDIGTLDLAGNPRAVSGTITCKAPQPGTPDMGAYEFIPAPSCAGPSNAFTYRVKGKKLIVSVQAAGTVAVSDAGSPLDASAAKKKRKLLLKPSSASGGPGAIVVPLRLGKPAKAILRRNHKVKVRARITFTPSGATANTQSAKLKIKTKQKKR